MYLPTAEDLVNATVETVGLFAGGFIPPFVSVAYVAEEDDIRENAECLVLTLSVDEDALVERDRGQVDIIRSVALLRIQDTPQPGELTF